MEIYFNHGKNIKNENYSYMLFVNIEKDDLEEKIENIEILSNNEVVTAVKNTKLNIVEYIFWKDGELDNVSVDNPWALIIEKEYIYVSDTTQKLETVTVSIK